MDRKTNTATVTLKNQATLTKEAVSKAFSNSKFKVTSFKKKVVKNDKKTPEKK